MYGTPPILSQIYAEQLAPEKRVDGGNKRATARQGSSPKAPRPALCPRPMDGTNGRMRRVVVWLYSKMILFHLKISKNR